MPPGVPQGQVQVRKDVMLSEAKHLSLAQQRPFASLRVTGPGAAGTAYTGLGCAAAGSGVSCYRRRQALDAATGPFDVRSLGARSAPPARGQPFGLVAVHDLHAGHGDPLPETDLRPGEAPCLAGVGCVDSGAETW